MGALTVVTDYLDAITLYTALLVTVVIRNVVTAVAVHARYRARVILAFAEVIYRHLGAS